MNMNKGLPKELVGKVTAAEWKSLRTQRLMAKDRQDVIDILKSLSIDSKPADKRDILKLAKGLTDDLAEIYD